MVELGELAISDPQLRQQLGDKHLPDALDRAINQASSALADLGAAHLALGRLEAAIKMTQDALNLSPKSQSAFHNLVSVLLATRQLHGNNLSSIQRHLYSLMGQLPWTKDYTAVLYMPHFLNIVFVSGKCNLRCRMCFTTQRPDYPNKLEHLTSEDFRRMLQAAPTVRGVTLSSGDAEPFLHPAFDSILAVAQEMGVTIDMYTNGQAITAAICRKMVDSGVMSMLNFSLDAATAETYKKIRGGDFKRVLGRIEMLQTMKKELGKDRPWVSLSFVAMADNVQELPDFIRLAKQVGAGRVFVEDLTGYPADDSRNRTPSENPHWQEYAAEARRVGGELGIKLQLPPRFMGDDPGATQPAQKLACCSWIQGVSVNRDGSIGPCCMIHGKVDMGNILDGPLTQNEKYKRVKEILLSGRVLHECGSQPNCIYVQQQKSAGIPLRVVGKEEVADLYPGNKLVQVQVKA